MSIKKLVSIFFILCITICIVSYAYLSFFLPFGWTIIKICQILKVIAIILVLSIIGLAATLKLFTFTKFENELSTIFLFLFIFYLLGFLYARSFFETSSISNNQRVLFIGIDIIYTILSALLIYLFFKYFYPKFTNGQKVVFYIIIFLFPLALEIRFFAILLFVTVAIFFLRLPWLIAVAHRYRKGLLILLLLFWAFFIIAPKSFLKQPRLFWSKTNWPKLLLSSDFQLIFNLLILVFAAVFTLKVTFSLIETSRTLRSKNVLTYFLTSIIPVTVILFLLLLSYISIALFYKSYVLSDKFIQRVERYNRQFFNQSAFVTFVKYSATRESLRQRVTLDRYARVFADEFGEKPFFKLQYMKRNTTNILTSRDFPDELEPGNNLPDWYDSAEYLESNSGLKRVFVNIFARPIEHNDRMFIRTASNVYFFAINTYEDEDIIIKLGIYLPMSAKVSNMLFKQYGIAFEQNEGVPTDDVSFLNSSFHLRDLESGESDGSATFRYYRSLSQILFSASTGNHAINYFLSGLRDLVFSLIIIFLILMSILGIIARNINRGIRLSLQKIIIGMRIIGEGNLDYKIDISSRDEYHRLANSINDMTEDIKHYMEDRVETERLKAEVNTAYAIQNSILPSSNPAVSGIEIASYIKSAEEVGGDFYDFHIMDKNRLGFVIGDVSGHGVSAGMLMAMAKSCFYNQNEHSTDVVKMMESMNNMVSDTVRKRLLMTFMYAIIDAKAKKMYYSNAGHHYPYLFRSSDSTLETLEYPSYPLGVRKDTRFKKMKTELRKDDYLIFYSDGIIEQLNDTGELFGFDRMEQLITSSDIKTAEELKELVLKNLGEFTQDNAQVDDITLIIMKVL